MCDEAINAQLKHDASTSIAAAKTALERVQAKVLKRGASSFKGMSRFFRIMDDDGNKQIGQQEFAGAMKLLGVNLTDAEVSELFGEFDRDDNGTINLTEFTVTIRPKMNKMRRDMVHKCFSKMDTTGDGIITVEDLASTYKVDHHPKFKSGEWTKARVLKNFLEVFEAKDHVDGKVTIDEFLSYYSCLSACIDNDMYFKLMMTNAWGE